MSNVKKSDTTLAKQHKVLDLPIAPSLYYFAQENGVSHRVEGTEENRQMLKEAVRDGRVRKVLVKYDVSVTTSETIEELVEKLTDGFDKLKPYYEIANQNSKISSFFWRFLLFILVKSLQHHHVRTKELQG